jgi:arylsulfatase A
MLAYLDKQIGEMLRLLDELGIADNTVLIFLADNGTDIDLVNLWGDGQKIPGGKGTMTDRGTRVPLLVRWPGRIQPGSVCSDLVDVSDIFPTLCALSGAKLPAEPLHGRSFAPQLFGQPGQPREWIHYQNGNSRVVRNREYMLTNKMELRRVAELGEEPSEPIQQPRTEQETVAFNKLRAAFEALDRTAPGKAQK